MEPRGTDVQLRGSRPPKNTERWDFGKALWSQDVAKTLGFRVEMLCSNLRLLVLEGVNSQDFRVRGDGSIGPVLWDFGVGI